MPLRSGGPHQGHHACIAVDAGDTAAHRLHQSHPGAGDLPSARLAAQLPHDLGDLGAPDTDAGDEAEERISSLSEQLQEQADVVEDAVGEETQGMAERLADVSTVSGAVAQMISDAQAAVADIRTLDGAQELEDAISSASSCQDLTS